MSPFFTVTGVKQPGDLQRVSPDSRRGEHHGMACAQFAGRMNFQVQIAPFYLGGRNFHRLHRQPGPAGREPQQMAAPKTGCEGSPRQ